MSHPSAAIRLEDLLDLGDYERRRDEIRKSAMAARALRRVDVGDHASLAFENRETVLYQIQEMLRAERIARPDEVRHEAETYGALLPTADELSAVLLLEYPTPEERAVRFRELRGIERHLALAFDGHGEVRATFDEKQQSPERVSAVQFVRFRLSDEQLAALTGGAGVHVVLDHPAYSLEAALPRELTDALARDLSDAVRSA